MTSVMKIKFWGVRGSIPSPGKSTVRYGGNTSCVSIHTGSNKILVLDAGTGIRELGNSIKGGHEEIFILLSHRHWDHIQGFPFFWPIYESHRKVNILSNEQGKSMILSLLNQMDGAHFPIEPQNLPSLHQCINEDVSSFLSHYGFTVSRIATNHPGNGYGYRVQKNSHSVIYLTDNELEPPYKKETEFYEFVQFCRDTDLLIHDAQYLEKDMPQKHGWGHSLIIQVCKLAAEAKVKHLILTHHDPERTDKEIDAIQNSARTWFKDKGLDIQCTAAYEGLTIYI
ncbi:MAG: MBL fold metallo-hydrolase [bacterium]